MKLTALSTALTALAVAGSAVAAEPVPGAKLGVSAAEIEAALGADGYEMRGYGRRDDRIDVSAVKDGRPIAIAIDAATGEVVRVEARTITATPSPGTAPTSATDEAAIRAALAGQGYEVQRMKRERDRFEVYATRDGRRWELKVDPASGQILRVEEED